MNGKKARMLRKQAGGNVATYQISETTRSRSLMPSCTRSKYKALKELYRLTGV